MSLGLLELRLPLPTSLRLRNFFENEARELQEFVSTVNRRAWPRPMSSLTHGLLMQQSTFGMERLRRPAPC